MTVHSSLTLAVKAKLYQLQAQECYCCKGTMMSPKSWRKKLKKHHRENPGNRPPPQPANLATFDHVVAIKCGGSKALGNVLLACHKCNSYKSAKIPSSEDIEYLREINGQLNHLGYNVQKIIDTDVAKMFKWLMKEMGYSKNGRK